MRRRCSWCGEKGIHAFAKTRFVGINLRRWRYVSYDGPPVVKCFSCHRYNVYLKRNNYKPIKYYYAIVAILSIVTVIVGLTGILIQREIIEEFVPKVKLAGIFYVLMCLLIISYFLEGFFAYISCGLLRFEPNGERVMFVDTDATATLTKVTREIKNLDVYMIKFNHHIGNVKFRESFDHGLVPVVFYVGKRGSRNVKIGIVKNSEIAKNCFSAESTFSVYDDDREIACGKIKSLVNLNQTNQADDSNAAQESKAKKTKNWQDPNYFN